MRQSNLLTTKEREMGETDDISETIALNGYTAIAINDIDPPFAYTVGLMFSQEHPELILLGLDDETGSIFAAMVEDIQSGKSFTEPGAYDGILIGLPIAIRKVHSTQHEFYLAGAMAHCRQRGRAGELEAVQVFWPDKNGLFPFDVGCDDQVVCAQPRLDLALTASEIEELRSEIGS